MQSRRAPSWGKALTGICFCWTAAWASQPASFAARYAQPAHRFRCCCSALEDGADDVLPSPFGLAECLARCRALVRRHQLGAESSHALRCGQVSMLVEEHRVCRDGAEVSLSPREFRLLHFFLKHPRRIWSRDELLARVWGESEAVELDPKTVDVHIRWLRLKLEENPAQPSLITTVRGHGYRCG